MQSGTAQRPEIEGHIPALDGVRGLAILVVMIGHFNLGYYPTYQFEYGLKTMIETGWWGVDLFFVLSGFLITGILLDAKGSSHYFRNFYVRRVLRIFPLYYGFLFAFFVLAPLVRPPSPDSLHRVARVAGLVLELPLQLSDSLSAMGAALSAHAFLDARR